MNVEHVQVLIAEDHTLFRDRLKALLASIPDIDVVGEPRPSTMPLPARRTSNRT